jgi:hypothetical protein
VVECGAESGSVEKGEEGWCGLLGGGDGSKFHGSHQLTLLLALLAFGDRHHHADEQEDVQTVHVVPWDGPASDCTYILLLM